MSVMGTRVVRVEDPRLLDTGGVYTEDLRDPRLEGAVYASFVRSPVAHARIVSIDASEALATPGVVAVLTAEDLGLSATPPAAPDQNQAMEHPPLASGTVRFVGEAVAVVLTETYYQGEDATELVDVDYDTLPPVVDMRDAARDETLLFEGSGTNVIATYGAESLADDFFEGCEVVVTQEIPNQRVAVASLEARAAAAVARRRGPADHLGLDPGGADGPGPDRRWPRARRPPRCTS